MTTDRNAEYLASLVRELCRLSRETEWAEFKVNNDNPQEIGEYISALANAAAVNGKAFAYVIWGIEDATHRVVGTRFVPATARKGNEPLETWLLRLLTPKIHVTNTSIRERFGIEEKNAATASRLLGEAVEEGMIAIRDPSVGTRSRTYLPYWAAPGSDDPGRVA